MKRIKILLSLLVLVTSGATTGCAPKRGFFVFEADERLFTTYALMNAAGFDSDWAEKDPIRNQIRAHLDTILTADFKTELRRFYDEHGGGNFFAYGVYALNCSFPPEFKFQNTADEDLQEFAGYDALLGDFYREADIKNLWAQYRERLTRINLAYEPYAELALEQITTFCRVDPDYFRKNISGHFYFQRVPLMSHYTGFVTTVGDDCWVVYGPASEGEEGPGAFYHESLHNVVNPIVLAEPQINERLQELLPLAQEQLQGDYNGLDVLIIESFVRTIDRLLTNDYYDDSDPEKLYKRIEDEYRLGHILCFYLMEALPGYLASGKTLKEYYPLLIGGVDIEKEKTRWRDYWAHEVQ